MERDPDAASRLRAALEDSAIAGGLWRAVRDADGVRVDLALVDAPQIFADWVNRPLAEVIGRRYSELLPSGIHERLPAYLRALETGEPSTVYYDRWLPDGRLEVWETRASPIGPDELVLLSWDVTGSRVRLRQAQDAHAEAQSAIDLLVATLHASLDRVAILRIERDAAGTPAQFIVTFVNEAAAAPTGRAAETWFGADLRAMELTGDRSLHTHLLAVVTDRAPLRTSVALAEPGGTPAEFTVVVTRFGTDHLLVSWWPNEHEPRVVVGDAPQRPRTDELTGLLTRAECRRRLAERLGKYRSGDRAALVMFDVDNFGRLNDLVGTHRADELLAALGTELRRADGWLELPARVDGDKFAGLVPGPLGTATVDEVWARLRDLVTQATASLGLAPLAVSAGIRAVTPGIDADGLLHDCDTALRSSQHAGGGRITVFSQDVRRSLVVDLLGAQDIRDGLAADQFQVAYQPVVRTDSLEWTGEEALLRWQHPEHGLLGPDRFIPLAESTGTIVELGRWVMDRLLERVAGSPTAQYAGVNVSAVQFLRGHVPSIVAAGLERTRADPGRVVVEITESTFMLDSPSIRSQLAELRQMGVALAVDDFGSGFSSIAALDWIPVHVVKLDQRFLTGELTARRRALLGSAAHLIRSIGARPLAEGIETEEHLEAVREAGIDLGQGFLFGRPTIAA